MQMLIDRCVNCLCRCCSKFNCPYVESRCLVCINNNFKINIDCDWFQNKKIAPKRFKIIRKGSKFKDSINVKLDYIIQNMGLVTPVVDKLGTFDVIYNTICLGRFYSYSDVELFISKMQPRLKDKLQVVSVQIKL